MNKYRLFLSADREEIYRVLYRADIVVYDIAGKELESKTENLIEKSKDIILSYAKNEMFRSEMKRVKKQLSKISDISKVPVLPTPKDNECKFLNIIGEISKELESYRIFEKICNAMFKIFTGKFVGIDPAIREFILNSYYDEVKFFWDLADEDEKEQEYQNTDTINQQQIQSLYNLQPGIYIPGYVDWTIQYPDAVDWTKI